MLIKCIKTELKKALLNKSAIIILVFLISLSIVHAIKQINLFYYFYNLLMNGKISGNPMITAVSIFPRWIGADDSSFESTIFYFLLPLIAVVPYAWSLVGEIKSGYTQNILCRIGRKEYFVSKYIAIFISAFTIIVTPLAFNFIVLSLFLPSIKMENIYPFGMIGQLSMWSGIYYQQPTLYVFMYIIFTGFFAGLIASISTMLSLFIKSKILVMIIPFFSMLMLEYLDTNLIIYNEFSPIKFLHALPISNDRSWIVILIEVIILLIITFGSILYKKDRYETI